MENENNDTFAKIKKYAKENQDQLLCCAAGLLCGIFVTRYFYERNLLHTTDVINDNLREVFTHNQGNFQLPDGTFPIPQLVKT